MKQLNTIGGLEVFGIIAGLTLILGLFNNTTRRRKSINPMMI